MYEFLKDNFNPYFCSKIKNKYTNFSTNFENFVQIFKDEYCSVIFYYLRSKQTIIQMFLHIENGYIMFPYISVDIYL